jgi:serralysin
MSLATGNNSIDSLVYGSWNAQAYTPVTLTYSFLTRVPTTASADDRAGFAAMSATQQAAVRDALAQWSAVANITFTETTANLGNLQFGTNAQDNSSGYAYLPEPGVRALSMYLNNKASYNSVFTPGSYGPTVLVHEIGHLLGLKHPGDYDSSGSVIDGPFLPAATDNGDYTQMSYNDPTGYAINHKFMTTTMLYDIQAIQYLYGANTAYHAGDDTYAYMGNAAPQCIWDGGGVDTLDFSACKGATIINLNAGTFSETARGLNNISIAYNVTIENAIASAGGSTIYANGAGNMLTGGAGADTFHEGAGSDRISGGGGQDTVVFSRSFGSYAVSHAGDVLTVVGDGTDILSGIERLTFSDRTLTSAALTQATTGTAGNDLLAAVPGVDTVSFQGALGTASVVRSGNAVDVTLAGGGSALLLNVERLQFSDLSLALDTDGTAGQLYRLYEAVFAREPDTLGMGFWLAKEEGGLSLQSIAAGFLQSPEFVANYGANPTSELFVTRLYQNVLHREPEAAGFAFHVANLDHGMSREQVLLGFSESAEFLQSLAATMPVGVQYIPFIG